MYLIHSSDLFHMLVMVDRFFVFVLFFCLQIAFSSFPNAVPIFTGSQLNPKHILAPQLTALELWEKKELQLIPVIQMTIF